MFAGLRLKILIAAACAVMWVAAVMVQRALLPGLTHAPGIDIIFLPSGIRLILLMIGGAAAAVGLSLGSLLVVWQLLNLREPWEIALVALCSGFGPYVGLLATQRLLGVSRDLDNIQPIHLPLIALGVAVISAVLHNLLFLALGLENGGDFAEHSMAMATGDFTGSLLAVVILFTVLRLRRPRKR